MRNNVALENRSEFRQKRLKMPEKAPKSLIFARRCRQSDLRGGSMSPRLFLQQNRAWFIFLNLLRFSPISALSREIGVLDRSRSQIGTQGVLGAYTGRKEEYIQSAAICSFFAYAYQLLSSVVTALYIFFLSVSNFLALLIFLWIRISEATPKEFLHYSKRETR